jgi:hypothetical protein
MEFIVEERVEFIVEERVGVGCAQWPANKRQWPRCGQKYQRSRYGLYGNCAVVLSLLGVKLGRGRRRREGGVGHFSSGQQFSVLATVHLTKKKYYVFDQNRFMVAVTCSVLHSHGE